VLAESMGGAAQLSGSSDILSLFTDRDIAGYHQYITVEPSLENPLPGEI